MSEPVYVPVLPTRQHAVQAYRGLLPSVQISVSPLWNVAPNPAWPPAEFAAAVRKELARVSRAQRHHSAWIDVPSVDEAQLPALRDVLAEYMVLGALRPVTGPDRPGLQQSAAFGDAVRGGRGLGIRVHVPGEWDGGAAEAVRELLTRADPAVLRVDLLLDMGSVLMDRVDAGKEALRALDALIPLASWRTAAVLGGAFPHLTAELLERGRCEEPRMDWHMWQEIGQSGRDYVPFLSYGDYGIQPASSISQVQDLNRRGGPDWGALRYTTDRSYAVVKVLHSGRDKEVVNRAAARAITDLAAFRGATASAGESWLRDCATGGAAPRSSTGTGNFTTWLRVGNIQHMTYLARSLGER